MNSSNEAIQNFFTANFSFFSVFENEENVDAKVKVVTKHLKYADNPDFRVLCQEIPTGSDWINVRRPLTFKNDLQGKVVILDFWTYCCINCIHILPDLHRIEQKYSVEDGLVIVGVHSAKFSNEKITENIRHAVKRYNISHPIVNDSETKLWDELQISCWPSLVVVGPRGQLLFMLTGEGHGDMLLELLDTSLQVFKTRGEIQGHSLPIEVGFSSNREKIQDTTDSPTKYFPNLSYPGKVYATLFDNSDDEAHLVISDTGNNRIILTYHSFVQMIIGNGERGYKDGWFTECQFNNPQGTAYSPIDNSIYVADTDNHLIRKIDLTSCIVSTVCGVSGQQGSDRVGGNAGTLQPISSPWDVCMLPDNKTLLIAMAGTHQIWAYVISDDKNTFLPDKSVDLCFRLAGSGLEQNKNSTYPDKAGFAQPSGLCCKWDNSSQDGVTECKVYVADSESSTIRLITLPKITVKPVCGGKLNPEDLFGYGDADGFGVEAKLQHPLDVTCDPNDDKLLYIADSYNHKIKMCHREEMMFNKGLKKETFHSCTYTGTGKAGDNTPKQLNQVEFNEPGGIDYFKGRLYLADTNNHKIKIINTFVHTIEEVRLKWPDIAEKAVMRTCTWREKVGMTVCQDELSTVTLELAGENNGLLLSSEPLSYWHILSTKGKRVLETIGISPLQGVITKLPMAITLNMWMNEIDSHDHHFDDICLEVLFYSCEKESGTCHLKSLHVDIHTISSNRTHNLNIKHMIHLTST